MKRLLYLAMLFLGLSIMTSSCEKMDGGNYSGASSISEDLLGKWIKTKTDYTFNGKVVGTRNENPDEYYFYDNGTCVVYGPKTDTWFTYAYAYDKSSSTLYLGGKYNLLDVSNNVAKMSHSISLPPDVNGKLYCTYEGFDIYHDDWDYYYVKNGEKIGVNHYGFDEFDAWSDTLITYYEKSK